MVDMLSSISSSPYTSLLLSPEVVTELLQLYGSPLYVYNGDRLRQTIDHITQAFPYHNTHFHFATVTNGNLSLLQIFGDRGWGIHANTPGDIYLALHAGFQPSQIVYSGSNLNRDEMHQVLDWGVATLNLDSLAQLQLLCSLSFPSSPGSLPRIGLRLNHPLLTGDSRIGVRPQEFARAIAIAHQAGFQISGLHFYRGTGTNATKAFTQVIDEVITIAQQLPDWRYLDFGGGFGYPYHHDGLSFNWQEFGAAISQRISQLRQPIELIIEPGRAAIAGCAALLCQVISVKWQDDKQIVGTDTTVANLSVPAVHGGYREIVVVRRQKDLRVSMEDPGLENSESLLFPTDICGNTTYSRDYLGRNCQLPVMQPGDVLAVLDVGAYGYAMSSHFLHRPRPAEVLLEGDSHRLIRRREDYSVLLANQVFTGGEGA
ncbi:diaminopimelate decarboxylase [Leptolyngbyaceae cyanobacterium JSC-12]|nr:diaminopimelate decarboxylase [Leptolyngbyaceae cyanobacterium JSC-12]